MENPRSNSCNDIETRSKRLAGATTHTTEEATELRNDVEAIQDRASAMRRLSDRERSRADALHQEAERLQQVVDELSNTVIRWEDEDAARERLPEDSGASKTESGEV